MAGNSREYELALRLNNLMDASFRQSIGDAERHIRELERAIRELGNQSGLDDIAEDADEASDSVKGLDEKFEKFNETFNDFAKAAMGAAFGSIVSVIGDQTEAMAQLQAATGVTSKELEGMKDSIESLYNQRLGEDFTDLSEAMATVRQYSQASGEALENLTKNAIVFRDVFGEEISESIQVSDTLMKDFGITSDQAYGLLAQGVQKGLNKSGDLMDATSNYSEHFKALGFSARQMFDVLAAGSEAGAPGLEAIGDVVQQFGERIENGSAETSGALDELFASIGGGQSLLDGLASGSIKGREAMQMVIQKLFEIEDPVRRNRIGVHLLGEQFVNMEPKVATSLGSARQQFSMTKETMEEIAAVKYDTIGKDFQAVGRELMTGLIIPIAEDLMPLLQGFAAWLSDNKDLVEIIALGAPAALLATNTVKIVRNLSAVQAAASAAGGAAGLFGGALGLLMSPVGIAVGAIGALGLGVWAFKRHQEEAREELLHLGDALEGAFEDYNQIDGQTERTKQLITEYDRLKTKINDAATPAEQLMEARRKLKNVEEDLIKLNPDILSAEDAKTERFREQLRLADKINESNREASRRDLETRIRNGEAQLSSLEAEYEELMEKSEKYNKAYYEASSTYDKYQNYSDRKQQIFNDKSLTEEQRNAQVYKLFDEVEAETGYTFHNNWSRLDQEKADWLTKVNEYNDELIEIETDMAAAEKSVQDLYNARVSKIEMDLNGSLDEQATNFNNLSEAERERFNAALQAILELNREMDLLPSEKKINLALLYTTSGQDIPQNLLPDNRPPAPGTAPKPVIEGSDQSNPTWIFRGYKDGGIADQPSIFGEAGPEIAIPLDNRPRSRALLELANGIMGRPSDGAVGGPISVAYTPQITIHGSSSSAQELRQALADSHRDFELQFRKMLERERRVSLR